MHLHRASFSIIVALLFTCPFPGAGVAADIAAPVSSRYQGDAAQEASFRRHVLPLMSKVGCSGRACHGSFQGQGGFRLSLFGYDFKTDHEALAAGDEPRLNLADPAQSLILLKPTGQEKHKGKKLFEVGSWQYNIIHNWVKDGANDDSQGVEIAGLEILPREIVFKKAGDTAQLRVLAHWSDGTTEDVTDITRFRTNDESVAQIGEATGLVTAAGGGDTHIVAFYDNGVAPIPVMLPVSDKVGPKYPQVAASTEIDALVLNKLRKVGIVPSGLATDAEFLRRVSLDMTGTLPTAAEVEAFLADSRTDKRQRKIEELLATPGYAAWWTTKLCDITGNNAGQLRQNGNQAFGATFAEQWYGWIHQRVAANVPYDQLVQGIALGVSRLPDQSYVEYCAENSSYLRKKDAADFADRPSMPYFYYRGNVRKPEEKALAFAHAFLGVQLACAECHKHPFDQWTQQDFKSFQAFFAGVTYTGMNQRDKEVIQMLADAGIAIPEKGQNQNKIRNEVAAAARDGKVVPFGELRVRMDVYKPRPTSRKTKDVKGSSRVITPKVLGGEEVVLASFEDPRQPLMDWMRSPENPYFARAWVNRVWAHYFGVGIIHPADDLNLANPPSNAELLDHLVRGFVNSGYDMKWLHRTIANTDTYQRSWQTNETNELDRRNFSHAILRRIPAEVAYDALQIACAGDERLDKLAADMSQRAIGGSGGQGNDARGGSNYALAVFGKPDRMTNCDCERSNEPTLLQSLFLYNDDQALKLVAGGGWIEEIHRSARAADTQKSIKALRDKLEALEKKGNEKQIESARRDLAKLESSRVFDVSDQPGLVRQLYLRTLTREPTAAETAAALQHLASTENVADGMRDLLWVMVNTKEFIINH